MREVQCGDGRHVRDGVAFYRLDLIVAEIQQLNIAGRRCSITQPPGRQAPQSVVAEVDRFQHVDAAEGHLGQLVSTSVSWFMWTLSRRSLLS